MQPEFNIYTILVLILYYIGGFIAFFCGYKVGKKNGNTYLLGNDKPLNHWKPTGDRSHVEYIYTKDNDSAEEHIVQRPTTEEINKWNEPQATREAKEELAKTFASIKEPEE